MKKFAIIISLLLVCNLMGCGVQETAQMIKKENGEALTASLPEDMNAASEDAAGRAVTDTQVTTPELEEQLATLAKERKQWLNHFCFEDGGGYDSIFYTVTDLNQNGLPEIVTYICEGSLQFTSYYVNEVTGDGTMKEWDFKERNDGYDAHLDIGADRMTVYYNEEKDCYAYICGDTMGGIGGIASSPAAIVINGMTIDEKYFGCSQFAASDKEEIQYHDKDGKEITRKEYDKLVAEATPEGKKGHAYFHWECKSFEELSALSEQEMKAELTELFQGFFVRFEQKNNKSYKKQIQYLVAQKKEWMKLLPKTLHIDGETIEAGYKLMIMDLNQNGCIELGVKYDNDKMLILEAGEDGKSMTEWSAIGQMPDFSSVRAYHSPKDASVHFVSSGEYEYEKFWLLESVLAGDNQVKTNQISAAMVEEEETEDDEDDIYEDADEEDDEEEFGDEYDVFGMNFYDGKNKKITRQEYDSIEQEFYKDLTPVRFYVQSIISPDGYYFDFEKLEKLTDEELTNLLQEGIECFYIE